MRVEAVDQCVINCLLCKVEGKKKHVRACVHVLCLEEYSRKGSPPRARSSVSDGQEQLGDPGLTYGLSLGTFNISASALSIQNRTKVICF